MAESFSEITTGSGLKYHTFNYTIGANSVHDQGIFNAEQNTAGYLANFGNGGATISTATINSHLFQLMAGPNLRVRLRLFEIYQITPATAASIPSLLLVRLSTAGTGGTAQTIAQLDPADAGAGATMMTLPAAKGTEVGGGTLWFGGAYFMQTIAASNPLTEPILRVDFDRLHTKPPIISSGTANGIALKLLNAVAGATVWINVLFDETSW